MTNIYLKLAGKVHYPKNKELKELIQMKKTQIALDRVSKAFKELDVEEITDENKSLVDINAIRKAVNKETKEITEQVKEENKRISFKMVKLGNYPNLNSKIVAISSLIKQYGTDVLINKAELDEILLKDNIRVEGSIEIFYDADVILLKLIPITLEDLEKSVLEGLIDSDRFNELVTSLNLKPNDKEN